MTDRPVSWLVIERGWDVVATDGTPVGKVHEVVGDTGKDIFDGLTVTTSALSRPKYVESERVGEITPGRVELTIGPEEVERLPEYEEPEPARQVIPEAASVWERIAGWFRR